MKCASKISIDEDSCLPKCYGLQISNFVKDSIERNKDLLQKMDSAYKMQLDVLTSLNHKLTGILLPAPLTSWSRYYLHRY